MNTYCSGGANATTFESEVKPVIGNPMDYAMALNKPKINGIELAGNRTNEDLLINAISNDEIEQLLKAFM